MARFLNTKTFFVGVLVLYLFGYGINAMDTGLGSLSSDLILYQMMMVQENDAPWSYIAPAYHREELYLAYPIFYHLNPGLDGSLLPYDFLVIGILCATYLISGFVMQRVTGNWAFAALGGVLILIPHNVGFTTIGISDVGDLRGNIFAFPFYLLILYFGLIEGINRPWANYALAVLAGALIYFYPIASVLSVMVFLLVGVLLYGRKKIQPLVQFTLVYLVICTPFLFVHFTNPYAQMVGAKESLTSEELRWYGRTIADYFWENGSLSTVDLARIKRTMWDTTPFVLILIAGTVLFRNFREKLIEKEWLAHQISLWACGVLITFLVGMDILNEWMLSRGQPPVFIEHIRAMRMLGFVLIMETMLVLSVVYRLYQKRLLVLLISAGLLVFPLHFSAPLVRAIVRVAIPESIRLRFNLAPVVSEEERMPNFDNTYAAAMWARKNLSHDAKVLVFAGDQQDFNFKFFSRRDTNLTNKDGSMWVTSGYTNSVAWFKEREQYDEKVGRAIDFTSVLEFAYSFDSTHILLPRGRYARLFDESGISLEVVYSNPDYHILMLK